MIVQGTCDSCARNAALNPMEDRFLCALCFALEQQKRTEYRGPERRREAVDPRKFGKRSDDPQD
jgi:hypothetical protein